MAHRSSSFLLIPLFVLCLLLVVAIGLNFDHKLSNQQAILAQQNAILVQAEARLAHTEAIRSASHLSEIISIECAIASAKGITNPVIVKYCG